MSTIKLLATARNLLVIIGKSIMTKRPNPCTIEIKPKWNRTARQCNKRQQTAGPFIPQPMIHLYRKQHDPGAPDTAQEGLGRQGTRRLMLVGVNKVVVGA